MAPGKANNLAIPPDIGYWTVVFKTGKPMTGEVVSIYDNAFIMKSKSGLLPIIMRDAVRWIVEAEKPTEEEKKESE